MSKFPINTILYAKGWYKHRGDVDKMWLDLCHTINIDGWMVYTKVDVATWCLHRFDELKKEVWSNQDRYCLSQFFADMSKNKGYWRMSYGTDKTLELSQEDLIIWTFMDYLRDLSGSDVKSWMKPSDDVLPFRYYGSSVETDWSTREATKWEPAEMHCDVIERINKQFGDAPEQTIDKKYNGFNYIESCIRNKKPEDVVVLCGEDSLLDCKEYEMSGKFLNRTQQCPINEKYYLELGNYNYCKFNEDKTYICRIKIEPDTFFKDDKIFTLMSVKEKK